MSNIRIERVPIQAFGLGKFRADHLMLVFQQDALDYGFYQDRWWVMEGTLDNGSTVGVDGADGRTTLSEANGGKTAQELLDSIKYPWWRGSHIIPSAEPFGDWDLMAVIARDIDSQGLPYFAFAIPTSALPISNSSSVIASLLFYAGFDIAQNMPSMFLTFTTGTRTLLGTTDDDELELIWSFDTILSGDGNDKLTGRDDPNQIDKLYGGLDDDEFLWSAGPNVIHGGHYGLDYAEDGIDTINYEGVGVVTLEASKLVIPHLMPDVIATHATGRDQLFSIERVSWNIVTDKLILGEGVTVIPDKVEFDLQDQAVDGKGDELDFSDRQSNLIIAPSDDPDVILIGDTDSSGTAFADTGGIWGRSVEWLIGSRGDDLIYAPQGLRGIEGGEGNDTIDGRQAAAFTGHSPQGYDIELDGGEGDDIIVSGTGRSIAKGGAGSDTFVLSSMSIGTTVEFIIEDAESSDQLLVPYNFLKPGAGDFENSAMMPILGGISPLDDASGFLDLPQHPGPGPGGLPSQGFFYFLWQTQNQSIFVPDASQGLLTIGGNIFFDRDGSDLLIHVFAGDSEEETLFNGEDEPYQYTSTFIYSQSEAVIRVKNFQEGMLGIQFHDLGEATPFDYVNFQGPGSTSLYSNWDAAVTAITNGGVLLAPLPLAPETPVYDMPEAGAIDQREQIIALGGDDDIIATTGPLTGPPATGTTYSSGADIDAGAGNDTITGSDGRDRIDGGTGNDAMNGGRGNDAYYVDAAGDVVTELAGGGVDIVHSSIDYVLTANVENLTLTGSAVMGSGNEQRNRLIGNAGDNVLSGESGNDTLYGAGGNDLLIGGEGSDGFVYATGDGHDIVSDTGAATDTDILALVGPTAAETTVFISGTDSNDVVLRFSDGGRVVLDDFFAGHSVERVEFQDGTVWDRAGIATTAAAGGVLANDAPIAGADTGFFTYLNQTVIPKDALLENDGDADGHALQIIAVSTATPGATASLDGNGDVVIGVAPGQTGMVSFTYTLSDGNGGISTGEGDISFFTNAAPVATGIGLDPVTLQGGVAWTYEVPLNSFVDPDGHSLVFTASLQGGAPLPHWLTFDPDTRLFSGTPPPGLNGAINVVVRASDSGAATDAAFQITVSSPNTAPQAGDDPGYQTSEGTAITFDPAELLDNDSDPDGDPLTITAVSNASGGTVALDGMGRPVFTPAAGYTGPGSFTYTISDGRGGTASAVVSLTVAPPTNPGVITGTLGNDRLNGTAQDDVFNGLAGNDRLSGGAGNDTFLLNGDAGFDRYFGGDGLDRILGGSGDDVIGIAGATSVLSSIESIDGGDGFDILRLTGGANVIDLSGVSISGIELIDGGAGADTITGSSGRDVIAGGAGADTLFGGEGGDRFLVSGISGWDQFDGGGGFDSIEGSGGGDTLQILGGTAALVSIETLDLGAGFDIIRTGGGNDFVDFSALSLFGVDRIELGAGNDTFISSEAAETVWGQGGADTFVFSGSFGADVIEGYQVGSRTNRVVDLIDLSTAGFSDYASVMAATVQDGADTVITASGGSIRIKDLLMTKLLADDFIL